MTPKHNWTQIAVWSSVDDELKALKKELGEKSKAAVIQILVTHYKEGNADGK